MSIILSRLETLVEGVIVKRPSKQCKTPYVADVLLQETSVEILGHSPSLGCCGLADNGASVLVSDVTQTGINKKQKNVCSHSVDIALFKEGDREILIGINPKIAENIAEEAIKNNCIQGLEQVRSFAREIKVMNSRFDFAGID